MTPEEEEHVNQMLELISSLANLTQQQSMMIYQQTEALKELQAQNEALVAIARAKQ